jgi:hypothetical protein
MSNQKELNKLRSEIEESLSRLKQIVEDIKYLNKNTKQWMITKEKNEQV